MKIIHKWVQIINPCSQGLNNYSQQKPNQRLKMSAGKHHMYSLAADKTTFQTLTEERLDLRELPPRFAWQLDTAAMLTDILYVQPSAESLTEFQEHR